MASEHPNQSLTRGSRVPVYLCLAVPIAVLASCWEVLLPAVPGRVTLMLVPILMAAVDGGLRYGLLTGALSAAAYGLTGAVLMLSTGTAPEPFKLLMMLGWAGAVVATGAWLGRCFDIVHNRAAHLQERCDMYERSIYQFYKDSDEAAAAAEQERARRQQEEAQRLDFSKLLLNIQHLGRELSGNLEMSAVFRLVTDAARKLLKARQPRLFLLDDRTGELVEYTPGCSGERSPADRGMLGWVVQHGQIITAEDVAKNYALGDLRTQDSVPWLACAPLVLGERVLGVLGIESVEQSVQEFDRLLYIVANFSAVALNNGQLFERVEAMARHDGLTGLLNHATFQSKLAEMHAEAQRSGQTLSLVLSDVDHFKQFNDRHGHQAGDYVLRSVAGLWRRSLPAGAIAARYGGEEFVCVFLGIDVRAAGQQAEALRFALEHETMEFAGATLRVTASFGVASYPLSADAPAGLIREADAALYAAKRGGRNRVCLAQGRANQESAAEIVELAAVN